MSHHRLLGTALLAACLTLFSLPTPAQTEDYARWAHFRVFSLNTPALTAPVANFPLLVRLDSSNAADVFAGARSGGADLRFRRQSWGSYDNLTDYQLSYQIAHWDSAARKAEIWVLMDTVKPVESDVPHGLILYWGKPDAPARSNAAAVFDSANGFVGVWHMGGSSPTAARANAAPGGPPAVPSGTVAGGFPLRAGAIGLADTLRGGTGSNATARAADDHFDLGSGYADFSTGATLSMWIKPATPVTSAWNVFMAFGNGAPGDNLTLGRMGSTQNVFGEVYNGTTGAGRTELNEGVQYNQWQQLTFTVRDSAQVVYSNGGQSSISRLANATIPKVTRNFAYLGRSLWADPNAAMAIDEVRLHKVRRSPDWVRLDYETQKPGSGVLQKTNPPAAPALISPADNALDAPAFMTLSWQDLSVNRYRVQLSTDGLFTAPLVDSVVSTTSLALGPLPAGTYSWRALAFEPYLGTSAWSEVRTFSIYPPAAELVAPVLVSPAAFATGLTWSVRCSWNHVSGATSYQLQVATVPDFSTDVRNASGITALIRGSISGIDFNSTYYWRVRAWNSQGPGPWSETRTFYTAFGRPATPALITPAPFATIPARAPFLSWSKVPGAVSYRVQVSLASDFSSFVSNDTTTDTSRTLGNLAGHTDYYWRVNAKNSIAASAYASPRLFATGEPVAVLSNANGSRFASVLRVGDETVLRLSLERAERVTVRWRDLQGRLSVPVLDETLSAGLHSLRVPDGPTGVGLLELGIGAGTRTLLIAP